jgi:urease alpha subunit
MKRLVVLVMVVAFALTAGTARAHVHGITPLITLAEECGVTTLTNTGANRAQGDPITGLIPRDVGSAPLTGGDGGRLAPVGCA